MIMMAVSINRQVDVMIAHLNTKNQNSIELNFNSQKQRVKQYLVLIILTKHILLNKKHFPVTTFVFYLTQHAQAICLVYQIDYIKKRNPRHQLQSPVLTKVQRPLILSV